jgi:hypothetical protein
MGDQPVKFGYDDKIPERIREEFTLLCQNLSRIQGKWDLFQTLYDPKNSGMLNDLASYAFLLINDSLFDDIILGICRFGDNEFVCGHKTAGLNTIYAECKAIPGLDKELNNFKNLYGPFKTQRNTHIAHTDYVEHIGDPKYHLWVTPSILPIPKISPTMIDDILECCAKFLRIISVYYSGVDLYFHPVSTHDGKVLVYWLENAHKIQGGKS